MIGEGMVGLGRAFRSAGNIPCLDLGGGLHG